MRLGGHQEAVPETRAAVPPRQEQEARGRREQEGKPRFPRHGDTMDGGNNGVPDSPVQKSGLRTRAAGKALV